MRKTLCVILLIPLMLTALFLVTDSDTRSAGEALRLATARVINAVRLEDWREALESTDALNTQWESARKRLQMWVNHADSDDVSLSLKLLRAAVLEEERFHALEFAEELLMAIEFLYLRDNLSLINII